VRPKSFLLEELVDPAIHKARGERAWELLDPRALITLQALRDALGPCTVNSWHAGGGFKESGLRGFSTGTGAAYSQHKYGRAFDCKFRDALPAEALAYVQANRGKFPHLTVIEDVNYTPTWFHFDVRFTGRPDIWIVKP
jgi:hypothetical protein